MFSGHHFPCLLPLLFHSIGSFWVIKSFHLSQEGRRISCSWGIWARSPLLPSSHSTSFSSLITLDNDESFCFDVRTTFMVSTCNKMRSEFLKGQICWNIKVTVGRGGEEEASGRQLRRLIFGGCGAGAWGQSIYFRGRDSRVQCLVLALG